MIQGGATLDDLSEGWPKPCTIPASRVRQEIPDATFFVVLDDDPTGTQSVAELPVLTAWEEDDFRWAIKTGAAAVYVVTNTRSLGPERTRTINAAIVKAASKVGESLGREIVFVSRSDSTLRGHFPLEPDTIAAELETQGKSVDGVIIVPAFPEAGRVTVGGVHYAGTTEDGFIPVGQTEFARDDTFGYHHSDLAKWVEEQSDGKYREDQVIAINLADLRRHEAAGATEKLLQAKQRQAVICDALTEDDLRLLSLALIRAEARGKQFIYRVGPAFVRARIGQEIATPLCPEEIRELRGQPDCERVIGGLIVVGSHVGLTTRQLENVASNVPLAQVELEVKTILDYSAAQDYMQQVVAQVCHAVKEGPAVIYTSRSVVQGADRADSLRIARQVSDFVAKTVQNVVNQVNLKFVVAKGGITSSDVAVQGLEMRRAWVHGPMLPGIVSLWTTTDGPAAGIPYAVFAGNVGDETSLTEVLEKLMA